MKILKPHPEFYKQYKDKTLQRDLHFKGIVMGYFIDVDGSVVLIVETDNPSHRPLHYLMYQHDVEIKDYHGNLLLAGINYDKQTKCHSCVIERFSV